MARALVRRIALALALLAAPALASRGLAGSRLARGVRAVSLRMMAVMPDATVVIEQSKGASEARVKLTIPGGATREVWDGLVRQAKTSATVNGFKQGTAPESLVIGAVGKKRLASDAIAALLEHYCQAALGAKTGLNAIGEPRVLDDSAMLIDAYEPGTPLTVQLALDLWPEVVVAKGAYDGLAFEIETPPFNQKAYDSTLKQLQLRQATLKSLPEATLSKEGDTLLVDMTGYEQLPDGSKGEVLNVAAGAELTIELLPGRFMPGLVEGLVGAKAGETRLVPVIFSQRSQQAALSGKPLLFEVNVKAVQTTVLPEIDDAFAASIQAGMTLAALNDKVREGVQAEVDKAVREASFSQLEQILVAKFVPDLPVPDTLITEHARKRWAQVLTEARDKQQLPDEELKAMVTAEAFEQFKLDTLDETKLIVRGNLLVDAIARIEGVAVSRDEMEEQKARATDREPHARAAGGGGVEASGLASGRPRRARSHGVASDSSAFRPLAPPPRASPSPPARCLLRVAQMLVKQSNPKGMEAIDDAMLMTQIEATLLREKVLDLIASRSTITKVLMKEED
jgi:trigger factor